MRIIKADGSLNDPTHTKATRTKKENGDCKTAQQVTSKLPASYQQVKKKGKIKMSKKVKQKILGIILIALGVITAFVTQTEAGTYDVTVAVLVVPLGLLCLFSRNVIID